MRVVIAGAGIGGLAAGVGIARAGHDVLVCERAARPPVSGSGISLFGNGFAALDVLGPGRRVRLAAGPPPALAAGQRRPDGSWLCRSPRLDETVGIVHRQELHTLLTAALREAGGELRPGTEVCAATRSGALLADGAVEEAGLVVAADGLRSRIRASWPGDPGVRYAGYSAWRGVTSTAVPLDAAGETWGRGQRFGIAPLADGRVYWFAVVTTPQGHRFPDERAELRRRFAGWHEPIPDLLDATDPAAVHRLDVYDLAGPVPTFRRGRCVLLGDAAHAMTPDLGQGGGQALEDAAVLTRVLSGTDAVAGTDIDAALDRYDALRRPRTTALARRARRVGRIAQARGPVTTRLRDAALRATPSAAVEAAIRRVQRWSVPSAG